MGRPELSLCMIVKDEEQVLRRCLDSVKECVDEIIVVDTGSIDCTVEIAREYGAEVYEHSWEGDFSKHRNQSVDYAKGEWIFQIDADEELVKDSCHIIREAICDGAIDALLVTIESFFNNGRSRTIESKVRIFRNEAHIRYENIVHNQVRGYAYPKVVPVRILHYGYDSSWRHRDKRYEQTIQLIRRQIAKEPDSYFHHLNLAVCYSTNFDYKQAVDEGLTALRLAHDQGVASQNVRWAYYIVSASYLKMNDLDNAEKYALKSLKEDRNHLDSLFVLTIVYHARKDWTGLSEAADAFLRVRRLLDALPEKFASSIIHMANETWRVHIALGDLQLHQRDMAKAIEEFRKAKSLSPSPCECHRMIGDCYTRVGNWEQAREYYELALQHERGDSASAYGLAMVQKFLGNEKRYKKLIREIDEDRIDRVAIFIEKGIVCLLDKMYDRAIDCFKRALELEPDCVECYVNMALAYKYSGRWEAAVRANLNAIRINGDFLDARINLGNLYNEMGELALAEEMYESVISLDPKLVDIRLRLCEIHVMAGNLEKCVHQCDRILERFDLSCDAAISNVTDLAGMFFLLSRVWNDRGDYPSSKLAMSVANELDPEIAEKLRHELSCSGNSMALMNAILGCTTTTQG